MKKFILIITALLICGTVYAYRIAKPVPINEINPTTLVELNATLEEMWFILNGRYNLNVSSTIPTGTTATEGDIQVYYSGSTYRLYIFVDNAWRYINFDG